jgi:chitinase
VTARRPRSTAAAVAVAVVVAVGSGLAACSAVGDGGAGRTTTTLPPPAPPPGGPRIVGYWPVWVSGGDEPYDAAAIPGQALSAVNYFLAGIDATADRCVLTNPELDARNLAAIPDLRARFPRLRVLASVFAPWQGARLDEIAADPARRARFVDACVELLVRSGPFDGIDLDWEFPGVDDRDAHRDLVAEFRRALDAVRPGLVLTAAIPAWADADTRYDLGALAETLDWVNLMAYDLRSVRDGRPTGFPAPLPTIDRAVRHLRASGVPTGKIVVGVPFYGIVWQGVDAGAEEPPGLGEVHDGPAEPPAVGFAALADRVAGFDPVAAQAFVHDAERRLFVAFDDPRSVRAKAAYVMAEGLGGLMIWHLGFDTDDHTLLSAAVEGLLAAGANAVPGAGS